MTAATTTKPTWEPGAGGEWRSRFTTRNARGCVTWDWVRKNLTGVTPGTTPPWIIVRWWEGEGPRWEDGGSWHEKRFDADRLADAKRHAAMMAREHGWGASIDGWAYAYSDRTGGMDHVVVYQFGRYDWL